MLSTETDDSDQNDPEVFRSYRKKKAALKGLLYKFNMNKKDLFRRWPNDWNKYIEKTRLIFFHVVY